MVELINKLMKRFDKLISIVFEKCWKGMKKKGKKMVPNCVKR